MATPYYDSGAGRSLVDLMLRRGQSQAQAHLARGDAAARGWYGAGEAITNAVSGWQRQVEENRRLELERARESRRAEAEGLQIESARMELGERQRQRKGAETVRNVLPMARREDGVYGYDREVIQREMEAAGHGDMVPDVFARLDEQETAYRNVLTVRKEAISDDALRVLRGGSLDDETFDNLLEAWEKNDLAPTREIEALRKAAKSQGVERALLAAVGSSEKGQQALAQMQAASAPQPMEHDPTKALIDKRTGETLVPAQPAEPKAPTSYEAAILAETDPAKRRQLIAEREQFARAGRAPAAPREEPLVAVIGDDGRPVMLPRSQAVGRQPASTRETGRQVTSGDAGDIAEFNTALDDIAAVREALAGNKATGAAAQVGASLPNAVTEFTGWGSDAKQKQAVIDRVKQVIGKALEGGVLRKEDEAKYTKILPTIGDPPDVVAAKLDGLEEAIQRRQERKIDALDSAGYDTSRFRQKGGTKVGRFTVEEEP